MVEAKGNLKRDILKCKREQQNRKVFATKEKTFIYHVRFPAVISCCIYKYGVLIASAFAIDFH